MEVRTFVFHGIKLFVEITILNFCQTNNEKYTNSQELTIFILNPMKVKLDFLVYSCHVNIESGHIIDNGDLSDIIGFLYFMLAN
jgi:hypothetical protein